MLEVAASLACLSVRTAALSFAWLGRLGMMLVFSL